MTLPSEKLQKRITPMRAFAIGAAGLVVIAGAAIGVPAAVHAMTPAPKPTAAFVEAAQTGQVNAAPAVSDDQQAQANQQEIQLETDNAAKAKAAADALAAQQAAADQAAKDAAAKKSPAQHSAATGPVRCPAGSSANSNDGVNDTSCFPDICFHIPVPDPAHPECDTAFKP